MCKLEDLQTKLWKANLRIVSSIETVDGGTSGYKEYIKENLFLKYSMDNMNGIKRQGAGMEKSLTDSDLWQLQHQVRVHIVQRECKGSMENMF